MQRVGMDDKAGDGNGRQEQVNCRSLSLADTFPTFPTFQHQLRHVSNRGGGGYRRYQRMSGVTVGNGEGDGEAGPDSAW